jgi:hypothetical protein
MYISLLTLKHVCCDYSMLEGGIRVQSYCSRYSRYSRATGGTTATHSTIRLFPRLSLSLLSTILCLTILIDSMRL